jgi:L-cystine transport system permease protein
VMAGDFVGLNFDVKFMFSAMKESIKYTPVTLLLAFVPFGVGVVLGTFIAMARLYRIKVIGRLLQIFVVVIKGIPVVLQILIIYFLVIQAFDGFAEKLHWAIRAKDINLIYIALVALGVFGTASISEAIRGSLISVNQGQYEAAYSVGMTRTQTMRRVILPQALPVAVPVLCSSLIGLVKGSSLVFMISVTDLMNAALIPANINYKYLEAYVAAAVVYWVINSSIEKIAYILEKRLSVYRGEGVL